MPKTIGTIQVKGGAGRSTVALAKPTLGSKTTSEAALAFAEAGTDVKPSKAEIPTARLNANIAVELHRALKMRAAAEGTSIVNLVEDWIKSWHNK
jgi:predicted HicB family RNase H-like nuclease